MNIYRHSLLCMTLCLFVEAFAKPPPAFDLGMNAMLAGDFAEAYCQWKPLAQAGYAEAQYNLGWLYANGNGMNVDMDKAFYWWKAAAAQGHADAQFALGLSYTTGEGVKRDLSAAAKWFYAAARKGHLDAREALQRLAGDLDPDLLATLPKLASEPWYGWLGRVTGSRVNVRAKPSTKAPVIAKLKAGRELKVLGRRGNWLLVQLSGHDSKTQSGEQKMAWVYHSLLKPVGPNAISR